MKNPGMFLVPDVSFYGAPGERYRAQVGPETLYQAKWFPGCMGRWWSVFAPHGVVGLRYSLLSRVFRLSIVSGSRVTGEDR